MVASIRKGVHTLKPEFNPKKLNKAIEKKNMNVPAIHKATNIPLTTLYDWVNGRRMPKVDGMKKIADCLGMKIEDLI